MEALLSIHPTHISSTTPTYYLRTGAVGPGTALQAGRSRIRFPMVSLGFSLTYLSGRTKALGSTQPLTEMSTRNNSRG